MRKSLAVALTQFRIAIRSKGNLASMFLLPLVLTVIFGLMVGGGGESEQPATPRGRVYPVAIIDEDRSLAATLLIEALAQEPSLAVRTASREELAKLIADLKVVAGFAIPPGFEEAVAEGRKVELELITHRGSNLEWGIRPILQRRVTQLAADLHLARRLAGSAAEPEVRAALERIGLERERRAVTVAREIPARPVLASNDSGGGYNALNQSALGFTVMSVMMSILMMAGAFLYERQHGTWGRLLTTPTERAGLLAGYLLSFFLTGLFQFTMLVFGTRLLFRVEWGPLLPLFTVGAAMVLAAAGIGLFLAGIVRTFEQQQTVGAIFIIATSMLGGLFWPLDLLSPTMQRIGYMTPQAWAMKALQEVALRGADWAHLSLPLLVLGALAAIFTTAGLLRIRFE
ncbi:MAG: ABC transporter permease [Bacillota bacterium]